MKLDKCPLCGEELQATVTEWLSDVVLDLEYTAGLEGDGYVVTITAGEFQYPFMDEDWGERMDRATIYCANAHTEKQMLEEVKKREVG